MAFNFLGKIPSIQNFKELHEFLKIELEHITKKIHLLRAEETRLQKLLLQFLFADLKLRSNIGFSYNYSLSQAPDLEWLVKSRPYSDLKLKSTIDVITAFEVSNLKSIFIDQIKAKRENLSFSCKRILDLIEQNELEIEDINAYIESFETNISSIYDKFKNPEIYTEIDIIEPEKLSDAPEYRLYPKYHGMTFKNNKFMYLVKSINSDNEIIFEHIAPPVKKGQVINLSGGSNNGNKKVLEVISANTLKVSETLIEEKNSNTEVTIIGAINV